MKTKFIIQFIYLFITALFIISCSGGSSSEGSCTNDKDCNIDTEICISSSCVSNVFLCQNKNCSGHGECIVENGEAVCDCDEGYIANGLSCGEAPCVKNSECEANQICQEGECKDETILCDGVNCSNHGNCVIENKEAKCNCDNGYIEDNLICKEDKCINVECSIIEMCNIETGACEVVINPCDDIDCGEHGECAFDVMGVAFCECENSYVEKDKQCVFDVPCVKTSDVDSCEDGLDNNCDGLINNSCSCDNGDEFDCYTGDVSRVGIGECKKGKMVCIAGEYWGECESQVLPTEEICDGLDNDCDDKIDKNPNGEVLSKDCYSGNIIETQYPNSRCKAGKYECKSGNYDETNCINEVLPLDIEVCGNSIDDNCDGRVDEDCVAPIVTCSNDVTRAYIFESPVNLSAEATDSNGTVVSTSWSFFEKPQGTASILTPTTGNRTKFTPDTIGEYVVRFTAVDNDGESSYCDINVTAKTRDHLNVTLIWDKGQNTDMDLHLLKPDVDSSKWGTINDCFWAITNPNWGDPNSSLDDPRLDRDDTDGFGPEVIQMDSPMDGRYTVGVDYFDDQGQGSSTATIKIICNGEEHTYVSNPLNSKDKWAVIDIVWANETCSLEPASRDYQ
jgi:hypothetical protein